MNAQHQMVDVNILVRITMAAISAYVMMDTCLEQTNTVVKVITRSCAFINMLYIVQILMNALILMEGVSTIVPIQMAATIAHVLLVILLMSMVTIVHVRCSHS